MARLSHYLQPVRLRIIKRLIGVRETPLRVLDVGCGNSSPTVTKKWLGNVEYHGVDIQKYCITEVDEAAIDRLVIVSPDDEDYVALSDGYYDVVIMNHVIEHMSNPCIRVRNLCAKLKVGGVLWIAFPSERSAGLPSADGTLNFFDDETHIYMPTISEIVNTLIGSGVKVRYAGAAYDFMRWLIGAMLFPWGGVKWLFTGRMCKGLWFVFGFETIVYGIKR